MYDSVFIKFYFSQWVFKIIYFFNLIFTENRSCGELKLLYEWLHYQRSKRPCTASYENLIKWINRIYEVDNSLWWARMEIRKSSFVSPVYFSTTVQRQLPVKKPPIIIKKPNRTVDENTTLHLCVRTVQFLYIQKWHPNPNISDYEWLISVIQGS